MIADVPVGCFLSGGVDSSLITYFAAKQVKNLPTYSVSFPGFIKLDETKYAQQSAKICGTKHTVIPFTPKKVRPIIENIGSLIDEPIIDAAFLPLYLLAQRARKDIKVILTGDAGDELFAGYQRYQKELLLERAREFFKFIPAASWFFAKIPFSKLSRLAKPLKENYSSQKLWNKKMLGQFLSPDKNFVFQQRIKVKTENPLSFMQKTDLLGFLAEQLLMKTDKATMTHSLEARLPYLDSKIINFAFELPSKYKLKGIQGKYLLKKVAEQYFPKSLVWRKKQGFSVPLNYWFKKELKDIVYDSIKALKEFSSLFDCQYYQYIVKQHMESEKNYADQIWGIIVLTKFLKYHRFNE